MNKVVLVGEKPVGHHCEDGIQLDVKKIFVKYLWKIFDVGFIGEGSTRPLILFTL